MEIRARYIQMGAFALAVMAAGFAFVYWLNNAGALRDRKTYRIRFENPVSGLLSGSAVLFNGIRVGEVTSLDLNAMHPNQVLATVAIERGAPVYDDTKVGIDFQGLTGSPVIALTGGSSNRPLNVAQGTAPLLVADPSAGQSMSQAARDVLRRLDGVLSENAEPLRSMLASLDTFAGALARNSDRIDGIVAGLERMTGGARARVSTYDLSVPKMAGSGDKQLSVQISIPDPTAVSALDSEKIQSTAEGGATAALPDVQWSDALPKLLQMKVIRGFDDARVFSGVSRPLDALSVDFQLLIDIRKFQIVSSPALKAEVEFAGKIMDGNGRIVGTRLFSKTTAIEGDGVAASIAALDQSFKDAAAQLMPWAVRTIGDRQDKPESPKSPSPKKAPNG